MALILRWTLGAIVGAGWMAVNLYALFNLLKIAVLARPKKPLVAVLLIKFPVLYLGGFLIVRTRFFPVSSLLAGLTVALIVAGVMNIWPKRT
ncbi:MAG: hypothetical protein WCG78_07510 [Candidatus Omnitrophota bacterium]